MPTKKPKSDYVIQTVVNALRLLEEFHSEDELGVTELSRRLKLHKNNVFRLLATLEQRDYIEQSPANERYRIGARCLELGEAFCRSHSLLERARPTLRDLARTAGETAHLALMARFGGSEKMSSTILVIIGLAIIIVPGTGNETVGA